MSSSTKNPDGGMHDFPKPVELATLSEKAGQIKTMVGALIYLGYEEQVPCKLVDIDLLEWLEPQVSLAFRLSKDRRGVEQPLIELTGRATNADTTDHPFVNIKYSLSFDVDGMLMPTSCGNIDRVLGKRQVEGSKLTGVELRQWEEFKRQEYEIGLRHRTFPIQERDLDVLKSILDSCSPK